MKKKATPRRGRREFTKAVAAALVAAPASLSAARAQTTPPAPEAKAPPHPQPTPAPQQTPPPSPVAAAYAEVARARFGERLTPDQWERVRRDLEGNVRAADRLRAHRLANADEPDFVFEATTDR